ncbi:MAG: c-type cytochrome [Pseudorhodobacter sp.]
MKTLLPVATAFALLAAPAFAEGDAEAGAQAFNQCQTCHIVADADGNTLAGRNAKTGPNLYAVIGRQAGTYEGFRYGKDLVEAGEKGLVWDQATFVEYVQDPQAFLKTTLGNNRARGQMQFRVRTAADAENLYAFLVSLAPPAEDAEAEGEAAPVSN